MINAPLSALKEECLLWQVDADEYWTAEQINRPGDVPLNSQENGLLLLLSLFCGNGSDRYHTGHLWESNAIRVVAYMALSTGDRWLSHEPPSLCRRNAGGELIDLARINPFRHAETEARHLIFDHHAYVSEAQIRFKEVYYGYAGALASWKALRHPKGSRSFCGIFSLGYRTRPGSSAWPRAEACRQPARKTVFYGFAPTRSVMPSWLAACCRTSKPPIQDPTSRSFARSMSNRCTRHPPTSPQSSASISSGRIETLLT